MTPDARTASAVPGTGAPVFPAVEAAAGEDRGVREAKSGPARKKNQAATVNPCRLCAPLGASLAIRGVRGGIPLLHGAQGCATYIRRYLISHFREPVDIGSSSFGESAVVFGGESHLFEALDNLIAKYDPEMIGVATTCLAETIGDDPRLSLAAWRRSRPDAPPVVPVSTPSYKAGHTAGFRDTARAVVEAFAPGGLAADGPDADIGEETLALLPPILSPADLRELRSMAAAMGVPAVIAPDFSDTMDGSAWGEYKRLPDGGTPLGELRALHRTGAVVDLGDNAPSDPTAGAYLESGGLIRRRVPLPIGLEASDRFFAVLSGFAGGGPEAACAATGGEIRRGGVLPESLESLRGRLVDAYADAHKYLYGVRVAVACNEHLAPALVRFVAELGMKPVLAASGGSRNATARALGEFPPEGGLDGLEILDDSDYLRVEEAVGRLKPDLVLSSSKAYRICRDAGIPLLRVDFPIHDRFGGPRLLNIGYRGTLRLLDELANTVLEKRQADSPVGFSYQ